MSRYKLFAGTRATIAVLLTLLAGISVLPAQQAPPPPPPPDQALSPDQLDDLVAPIALYPDPLLSQLLVAATYPLEVVQAFQWLQRNPGTLRSRPHRSRTAAELGCQCAGPGRLP